MFQKIVTVIGIPFALGIMVSPAKAGSLKIVAIGDSTTAGTPYFRSPLEEPPEGRGKPEGQYTYWMRQKHPDWQILNKGINGQRTDEIKARFVHDAFNEKPRYAIILAGVNDIVQGHPLTDIEQDLLWMYQQAKAKGIIPIAASVLPFDRATEVQARKIRGLNRWIQHQTALLNTPFCDLNAAVRDAKNHNRLKGSPDGLHPDIEGYRSMGQALTQLIEKLEAKGGVTLTLQLTSPAFAHGSRIPKKYTCNGDNVSPELNWTNPTKAGTQSFMMIMEDPDAPAGNWVHWVVYNIPPAERKLKEKFPADAALPDGTLQGVTDFGTTGYGGPCPPSGTHRYFFKLFALDSRVSLLPGASRQDAGRAIEGHILEKTELMGTYSQNKKEE